MKRSWCLVVWILVVVGLIHGQSTTIKLDTPIGIFEGQIRNNVASFRGIPFAKPPVGELRWHVPVEYEGFAQGKYFNATAPGSRCPQSRSAMGNAAVPIDEDCLYLNVEIPLHLIDQQTNKLIKPESLLNVMFFIHGGAYALGSGVDPYIKGEEYAKHEVILVSPNYRLGILGFFTLPEILKEDSNAYNFGLLDQRMAIGWVKQNIHHFGGDKAQITLFGESAGAMSILWQLSAVEELFPEHQRLTDLKGAIIQSAADLLSTSCDHSLELLPGIQDATGCHDLRGQSLIECLRAQSAQVLIDALPDFIKTRKVLFHTLAEGSYGPCLSPGRFPLSPRTAIHQDQFNANPNIMIGTCRDEGTLFSYLAFLFYSDLEHPHLQSMIEGAFMDSDDDDDATKITQKYVIPQEPGMDLLNELVNDAYFQCGTRTMAEHFSSKQPNTYRYLFNHQPSTGIQVLGVYHSAELAFMFHELLGGLLFPSSFTEDEEQLSRTMITYWANFAKYGNPSPASSEVPNWPKYSKDQPTTQVLQLNIETTEDFKKDICEFWEEVYPEGVPFGGRYNELQHESWSSYLVNETGYLLFRKPKLVLGFVIGLFVLICVGLFLLCRRCCCKRKVKTE